jgi:excisionase family DNA binding protein
VIAAGSPLLTYEQAGDRLGVGVRFIRNAIAEGRLVGTDLGPRAKRVSVFDLEKFVQECRTLETRGKRR